MLSTESAGPASGTWQLRPQRSRIGQDGPISYAIDHSSDEKTSTSPALRTNRRVKRRKRTDRALHPSQRPTFNANSVMSTCTWCHKVENKKKLKRGVTSVVGRPRDCWTQAGLPLLYTCCCCYEERRKGRMLEHKKELLKAQYRAFDGFGVEFYEMRKKVGDKWAEWIAGSDEVWFELAHAFYVQKSFDGIKASPITSPAEVAAARARQQQMSQQQRGRTNSVSSVNSVDSVTSSVFGCVSHSFSPVPDTERENVGVLIAAEILMDMSSDQSS